MSKLIKMMRRLLPILALSFLIVTFCNAQTYIMDGTPINDCSGFFSDSGGNNGTYSANENLTTTICPDFTSGTHIQLVFSGVDITAGDELCFFDGDDVSAPPISCATDFDPGAPFIIQASAVNVTGCLTITFNSDGAGEGDGWSADINCIPACQTIIAELVSTDPIAMPADTGWIDICPGEGISFEGAGFYPQNGAVYEHSDLTSSFTWSFGDGTTSQGPTAFHTYNEPGGYIVQLTIEDQFGCVNSNYISQRVRVSTYPDFELGTDIPATICAGDTVNLSAVVASIDSTYEVSVSSTQGTFQTTGVISDSLPLPDGTGSCYETSILFSDFSPGQVLTNINDLVSICINAEHSYLRDLYITLTCPDGTEVILEDQTNSGGENFLGVPYELDDIGTPDPPAPGIGWDYCWTPNATNGTWLEYCNANNPQTLPEGDYNSFEPLDNFLGCPLNGEWTIQICDNWGSDNGWLFEWSITFASDLYPNVETFTPEIIDWSWQDNPSIFFQTLDSISAAPQNAGTASYQFSVTNDFGCTHDTIVLIDVLPPTHTDCHSCEGTLEQLKDTLICSGDVLMLDAAVPVELSNQEVTFEAYANVTFDNNIYPPGAPYASIIDVSNITPGTILDATSQIVSVCLNLTHPYDSDVELYLQAPNGAVMELSTDNGGSGDNYTGTCFTPVATLPITAGTPPFTGDFLPEGNWTDLNGTPVAGDWALLVSDDQNGISGNLLGWTITFVNDNNITYDWFPPDNLNCTNCPDPEASPTVTTSYIVTSTDEFNCSFSDTILIEVVDVLSAPIVNCGENGPGELIFSWMDIVGATGYEVSLDGGMTWIPANGTLSHVVSGLLEGEEVTILIRAIADNGCDPDITTISCNLTPCDLVIDTSFTVVPSCYNIPDGSALMTTMGGTTPIDFYLDGVGSGPNIANISSGMHTVIAIDAAGCSDTMAFMIPSPDSIEIAIAIDSITCFGLSDGTATANTSGGTGTITYEWNTVPVTTTPILNNVSMGSYTLVATDANGCTAVAVVDMTEPTQLQTTLTQDSVDCNANSTGTATATPMGGVTPYTYAWNDGQTTATAINLTAGQYEVIVSDANNCSETLQIDVLEPDPLLATLMADSVSCFGVTDGMMTLSYLGGVGQPIFNWSGPGGYSSTDQNPIGLAAGNYCVTVSDENGCEAIECFDVDDPAPISLVATSTPPFCETSSEGTATVTPDGGTGPYTYLWADGQTTQVASGLSSGDIDVTVTDANGCQSIETVTVDAVMGLTLVMSSDSTSCANINDGAVTVEASGGQGTSYGYLWGNNTGSQTTATATGLIAGNYCVTVSDTNGCTATDCVTISSPDPVLIENTLDVPVSCYGFSNGQAEVVVSGGSGPGTYTYLWDDFNSQFLNPAVFLSAGFYNVTVTDANGCTEVATVEVTQPDTLAIIVSAEDASCFEGTDGTATVSPTGGSTPYNYNWSNFQTTETATGLSTGFYGITVTDDNGCSVTTSISVGEPATAVSVEVDQTFVGCFDALQGEALAQANGGTPGYTYEWSNGIDTDFAQGLDTGFYVVTVTDAQGCTQEDMLSITQLTEVTINVAFVEPDCYGQASGQLGVNIVDGGVGGGNPDNYDYVWNTVPVQTVAYIDNVFGGQFYEVTVTDAQGCSAVEEVFLDQPDPLSLGYEVTDAACADANDGFVSITNVAGGTVPFDYQWDANANNQTDSLASDLGAGTYSVTVTDAFGCTSDTTMLVAEPTPLSVAFETNDNLCNGDTIGSIETTVDGGTPNYSFAWSNGLDNEDITNLQTGQYILTITDANGCELIDTTYINQPVQLEGAFESEDVTCFGDQDGSVQISVEGGALPYNYSFGGSDFNGVTNVVGLSAGDYEVTIMDGNGCTWTSTASVGGPPAVEVDAGEDITIGLGETATLTATTNNAVGDVQLSWFAPYAGTLFCPQDSSEVCESPLTITQNTITYEVYAVDANGCEATDEITVTVEKKRPLYVPTAFTPNNDAVNSLLTVHGRTDTEVKLFRVYDRWGNMVYEARDFMVGDLQTGWDGTFKGKMMQPGVYVWYIEALFIDGYEQGYNGQTTLIR